MKVSLQVLPNLSALFGCLLRSLILRQVDKLQTGSHHHHKPSSAVPGMVCICLLPQVSLEQLLLLASGCPLPLLEMGHEMLHLHPMAPSFTLTAAGQESPQLEGACETCCLAVSPARWLWAALLSLQWLSNVVPAPVGAWTTCSSTFVCECNDHTLGGNLVPLTQACC